jgi:small multidrug resistance pump
MLMAWVYLVVAIVLEVSGTTSMKLSRGFSELWPSVAVFVFYALSLVFLTFSIQRIDIGVAYAIWSALGTALVVTIGIVHFGEAATAWKLFFLALIVFGVIGLRLTETA